MAMIDLDALNAKFTTDRDLLKDAPLADIDDYIREVTKAIEVGPTSYVTDTHLMLVQTLTTSTYIVRGVTPDEAAELVVTNPSDPRVTHVGDASAPLPVIGTQAHPNAVDANLTSKEIGGTHHTPTIDTDDMHNQLKNSINKHKERKPPPGSFGGLFR